MGSDWIKGAAREAMRGNGFAVLLVLGFAFDPQSIETVEEFRDEKSATELADDGFTVRGETHLRGLWILLVRMNSDLNLGQKLLKKAKNANLFTVFGEPNVRLESTPEGGSPHCPPASRPRITARVQRTEGC